MSNIIYILTNEVMPGIVKIGKTDTSVEQRMKELYKTGVPVPFECFHASEVENSDDVEKRLHRAFSKYRINKNREFFEIEPQNIFEILELLEIKDVTPKEDFYETEDDLRAIQKLEKKAERFSFKMVGINEGEILTFSKNENLLCTILKNQKVLFNEKEMSLSAAALEALYSNGYKWKSAQGAAFWMYKNELLKELRNRIESE